MKKPKPHAAVKVDVIDGWSNALTGIGQSGKDKTLNPTFVSELYSQLLLEQMWRGDDKIARIVEKIPDEMLREGFTVSIEGDNTGSEKMDEAVRDFGVIEVAREALYYARAYGGAGVLLGAQDGSKDLGRPLNENTIQTFDWMSVYSPIELPAARYYSDPTLAHYGRPDLYWLHPLWTPAGSVINPTTLVHESRLARVDGIKVSRRYTALLNGWDDSVMVRCLKIVQNFQQAMQGVGILLSDFSVPVLKVKGLSQILLAKNSNTTLAQKIMAVEMCRSVARCVVIDAEEEWKRESTTLTGLPDVLDKMILNLASAAGMPVSLLMGQAPAGLNATGDSDIRWFYDQIASMQEQKLRPFLKKIVRLLFLSKNGPTAGIEPENWDLKFHPLWQLSRKDEAQVRSQMSAARVAEVGAGILAPEEVADSMYGGDEYSIDVKLDPNREALLEAAKPEPIPAPPSGAPPVGKPKP